MPRLRFAIFVILPLLIVSPACWATTYYVDATNGNDSNPGTSQSAPWKTVAKVNASSFSAGDAILFNRGDTWEEMLQPASSGSSGNPIVFDAYGSGEDPIITAKDVLGGWDTPGNWTESPTNVWRIGKPFDPYRVWFNGIEYKEVEVLANIDATNRWAYFPRNWTPDPTNKYLYVYATSNPASFYSSIEVAWDSGAKPSALKIDGQSHLTFKNVQFEGGAGSIYITAHTSDSNYIIFDDCRIGNDAGQAGLQVKSEDSSYVMNYGEVKNSTISSGILLSYDWIQTPSDGISLNKGSNYWKIYQNTIKDWMHNLVAIGASEGYTASYNEVYDNYMTLSDEITYCRAYSTQGNSNGNARYNKFYRNYIKNLKVRSQIGGDYNEVFYNIFDTMHYDIVVNGITQVAQAISVGDYGTVISQNNKIYNNVIYNTDEPGIMVRENTIGGAEVENNEIFNNIIINSGNNSGSDYDNKTYDDIGLLIIDDVGSNTYKNNLIYKSGVSNPVSYRGSSLSVTEFNVKNGNDGDIINGNIQSDPMFVDMESRNFRLTADSSSIDAGLDVNLESDYAGNIVPKGGGVDIGAFEYDGATISAPKQLRILQSP